MMLDGVCLMYYRGMESAILYETQGYGNELGAPGKRGARSLV